MERNGCSPQREVLACCRGGCMLNWHLDLLRLHAHLAVSDSPYEIIDDASDEGGHRAYGWLPLMASSSGFQIWALCAESFCERILSEANDVCHEWNTLLDTEDINMLVVLRMNREFMQHMREIYPKFGSQNFNEHEYRWSFGYKT